LGLPASSNEAITPLGALWHCCWPPSEDGHLLHAGALIDAGPAPRLSGLGFSRLSQDQLRPLIEKDPAVSAGMETFRLVAYAFPKGGLTFAREAAEHA
jgi:hypothetical protein